MKAKKWWRSHEGWIAALFMAVGAFAMGYMIASIHYDHQVGRLRAHQSKELAHMADSYTAAMKSKDQLINQLARKTERAATKASKAASKVADDKPHPELDGWMK